MSTTHKAWQIVLVRAVLYSALSAERDEREHLPLYMEQYVVTWNKAPALVI